MGPRICKRASIFTPSFFLAQARHSEQLLPSGLLAENVPFRRNSRKYTNFAASGQQTLNAFSGQLRTPKHDFHIAKSKRISRSTTLIYRDFGQKRTVWELFAKYGQGLICKTGNFGENGFLGVAGPTAGIEGAGGGRGA